ncbi:hypothetical protein RRG08_024144 [Elysia crispata]|uniref:Uncharacterized protein n=1 Tax=Elysia crispata TaxID=231223 RepID=A0AAE0YRR2_9GAST|nr:hypothetical protein RRG08_024144 [Elysia crispata]
MLYWSTWSLIGLEKSYLCPLPCTLRVRIRGIGQMWLEKVLQDELQACDLMVSGFDTLTSNQKEERFKIKEKKTTETARDRQADRELKKE